MGGGCPKGEQRVDYIGKKQCNQMGRGVNGPAPSPPPGRPQKVKGQCMLNSEEVKSHIWSRSSYRRSSPLIKACHQMRRVSFESCPMCATYHIAAHRAPPLTTLLVSHDYPRSEGRIPDGE